MHEFLLVEGGVYPRTAALRSLANEQSGESAIEKRMLAPQRSRGISVSLHELIRWRDFICLGNESLPRGTSYNFLQRKPGP